MGRGDAEGRAAAESGAMSWGFDEGRFRRWVERRAEELEPDEATALRAAAWAPLAMAAATELEPVTRACAEAGRRVLLCQFDHDGAGHGVLLDAAASAADFGDGPVDPTTVLECAGLLAALPDDARDLATQVCVYLCAEVLAQNLDAPPAGADGWAIAVVPEHDAASRWVLARARPARTIFDDDGRLRERALDELVAEAPAEAAALVPLLARVRGGLVMELLAKLGAAFTRIARTGAPAAHRAEVEALLTAMVEHAPRAQFAACGALFEEVLTNALCCVAGDRALHELVTPLVPAEPTSPVLAHNLACVAAAVGAERAEVLRWVRLALDLGRGPDQLRADPDLAALAADPEFTRLLSTPSAAALATQLGTAVAARDLAAVEALVAAGADPTGSWTDDGERRSILLTALTTRARKAADREARLAVCRYLLGRGARLPADAVPWYAVRELALIELLLDHGVAMTTALVKTAVEQADLPLLERLLARGLDLGAHPAVELLQACRTHQDPATLTWLLARGLPPDSHDARSYPALLSYASAGAIVMAEALLVAGADLGARDAGGGSVISHALFNDKHDFVAWAIDRGAELSVRDHAGRGLVTLALSAARCLPLLLARGAPVDLADDDGQTALHHAAAANDQQAVEQLLAAGADRDRADQQGQRPADLARGAVRALLDRS